MSKVTRLLNILEPLLNHKGSNASDVQEQVSDHAAKLKDSLVKFNRDHEKFTESLMESLENEADEALIEAVADANNQYLTEAEAPAYQTLRKIKIFKAEVAEFSKRSHERKVTERDILPGLKKTFTRSVEKFRLEVTKITSKLKEFDSKTVSQLKGIPSIKYLNISGAKTDLEASFSGLYDARADYSEALESFDMDISEAACVIFPDGSFSMEQSTTDYMNWQEQAEIVLGVQREMLEELQQNKPQALVQTNPSPGDKVVIKLPRSSVKKPKLPDKDISLDAIIEKCPPELRQMSLKEEKEHKKLKDKMYLDVEGTTDDPGPGTKYPCVIPDLEDNYTAVHDVMTSTARKLNENPDSRKFYEDQLKDLVITNFAKDVSSQELNDEKFPDAAKALTQNSYVDITFDTAPNHDKVEEKIKQVETVSGAGGFSALALTKSDRNTLKNFEKVSKSFKVVSPSEQGELHYGPLQVALDAAAGELHPGPSNQQVPGDKPHVPDILIDRSSSLDKISNATAFVLRLGGRIGKEIPEKYKKMSLEAKHENNLDPDNQDKIPLLRLNEYEQKEFDMKKSSGFNHRSNDFVFAPTIGNFAKKIIEKFHRKFHKGVKKKIWGILFVCYGAQNIHLDFAEDYSVTVSVLLCFTDPQFLSPNSITFLGIHLRFRIGKLVSLPPGLDADGSPEYNELDRHAKNLIVIGPNNEAERDDGDHGIAGSVELSQPAPTES